MFCILSHYRCCFHSTMGAWNIELSYLNICILYKMSTKIRQQKTESCKGSFPLRSLWTSASGGWLQRFDPLRACIWAFVRDQNDAKAQDFTDIQLECLPKAWLSFKLNSLWTTLASWREHALKVQNELLNIYYVLPPKYQNNVLPRYSPSVLCKASSEGK